MERRTSTWREITHPIQMGPILQASSSLLLQYGTQLNARNLRASRPGIPGFTTYSSTSYETETGYNAHPNC
jgi:hypothetical protein